MSEIYPASAEVQPDFNDEIPDDDTAEEADASVPHSTPTLDLPPDPDPDFAA